MSVVPLHIVTEQDVRDFLASQPDRQEIEARTGYELRLICALYRGDSTNMSREACARFVELVVQSEVSLTTYQTTQAGDAGLPGRLSMAGSATSLIGSLQLVRPVCLPLIHLEYMQVLSTPLYLLMW